MSDNKRKRSPNWLLSEKKLLIDLVEKHFRIIENKKTDGVSMKTKLAEWQIISIEYNSQTTHCHRTAENLRSQWENMKKAAKKEASNARLRRIQTGGGPPDQIKEDPNFARIVSLIKTSAVGLFNPYDNDSVAPAQAVSQTANTTGSESEHLPSSCNIDVEKFGASTSADNEVEVCGDTLVSSPVLYTNENEDVNIIANETQTQEFVTKNWGDYTPQLLRTPVSTQLKTDKTGMSRRRPLHTPAASSLELLHKHKIEAIKLQTDLAREEAEGKKITTQLEMDIKKEILKQEKLKTRMLLLGLKKKKKEHEENSEN